MISAWLCCFLAVSLGGTAASSLFERLPDQLPIVLWHGMGDSCCDPRSLGAVAKLVEKTLPGRYVRSIQIGATPDDDRKASFFGRVDEQVAVVCQELAKDTRLRNGFDAIGFSQGGQFLRAFVQRCNQPQVHTLITLGAQHTGVSTIPKCVGVWCTLMRSIAARGVYLPAVQTRLVQAQYYRDPRQLANYLAASAFLADINNERSVKNYTYAANLATLKRFVMVQFLNDTMVTPKESAWFQFQDEQGYAMPFEEHPLYTEDWIGLKKLHQEQRLEFLALPGDHLDLPKEVLVERILLPYLAKEEKAAPVLVLQDTRY